MAGNPNFFRKIDFQLAQILDLPKFSQEEGGEGLDTKEIVPEGEEERPDDLTKSSHERKGESLVDHKILDLQVFSRENKSWMSRFFL